MAARPTLALLATLALASGCKNECQKLCDDMADFAADECGHEVPKEELKACRDAYKGKALEDGVTEICEDIRPTLTEEWTCDEIDAYFVEAGASAGGGGSDSGR